MMTRQYRLSSPAEQDIAAILEYIAKRNLDAALELVDQFTELFELIAAQPELGERYGDPGGQMRRTSLGNYVIIYQLLPEEMVILRVLHGAQDWQSLLRSVDPDLD